jgi:DNA-binding transcriptional regulator LsrR (DeoR family)
VLSAPANGAKSPAEMADSLSMSEQSMTSLLSMLAQQGRIRIRLVEAV